MLGVIGYLLSPKPVRLQNNVALHLHAKIRGKNLPSILDTKTEIFIKTYDGEQKYPNRSTNLGRLNASLALEFSRTLRPPKISAVRVLRPTLKIFEKMLHLGSAF